MDEKEIKSTLTIPLYWTFHFDDIDRFEGLSPRELQEFLDGNSEEDFAEVVQALAWAKDHPQEDFSSILPGLQPSNDQLYRYLVVLHSQLCRADRFQR